MRKNVYLIPLTNGTYAPCVAEKKPRSNAIFLTEERSYPTLLSYMAYDAYGCSQIYGEQISNQTELLGFLFTCGEMCYGLVGLWDYDLYRGIGDDLLDLFNTAYGTWMEAIRGDGAVNARYVFTETTSLEEYCERCLHKCDKALANDNITATEANQPLGDYPF
jgi:hypothetical protein